MRCLLIDRKPVVTAAKENAGMKLLVKVKRVNQEFPTWAISNINDQTRNMCNGMLTKYYNWKFNVVIHVISHALKQRGYPGYLLDNYAESSLTWNCSFRVCWNQERFWEDSMLLLIILYNAKFILWTQVWQHSNQIWNDIAKASKHQCKKHQCK